MNSKHRNTRWLYLVAITLILVLGLGTGGGIFARPVAFDSQGMSPTRAQPLAQTVGKSNVLIPSTRKGENEAQAPVPNDTKGASQPVAPLAGASSNYAFTTATNASLTDMSTGTTQLVGASADDSAGSVTNIGFDFYLMGTRYSQFSITSNGMVALGSAALSGTNYTVYTGSTATPIIAAFGGDLCTGSSGKVHYKVIGSAPNRVLVIEFLNMTLVYNGATFSNDGTSQVRLYETTGQIEFVYGSMSRNAGPNSGGGNGLQLGIGFSVAATTNNFVSITSTTNLASSTAPFGQALYAAGPIASLDSAANGSRRIYSLTPPIPTAPTALNFTGVTATSMTLNWTDAPDEVVYAIYRSTDGVNYSFVNTVAANGTSSAQSGLSPATTYFWKVYSVSEGALSTALSGSQATSAPGTCVSVNSGNWTDTNTWSCTARLVPFNGPPTAGDNVIIANGTTVTIDTAAVALGLTVNSGGTLVWDATIARTLTVGINVTIDSGGTFQSAASGTVTTHVLSLPGNLTNNGTLDFSTNADTAGAGITFTGASNNTFGGTGATTDIRAITINKGTSNSNILELNPTNFTVRGVATDVAGFLTLTNGTFKISGSFTVTNRVITGVSVTIGATQGFWLNNPNFTVAPQNGTWTVVGLFRMSQGTFNVGTAAGNALALSTGSTTIVEGGAINSSGRVAVSAATQVINYTQTGGTITVCTVGNTSTTLANFDMGTSLSSSINISGGTIIVQLASTAASGPRDYRNQAGSGILTGGTLQMGNAASGTAKSFSILGTIPNLVITNTSASHSVTMGNGLANYYNSTLNITINTGNTFNMGSSTSFIPFYHFMFGTTFTNNGTFVATDTSDEFRWNASGSPQSYTGTGVVTPAMNTMDLLDDMGLIIDPASPRIPVLRINFYTGSVTNSNRLTLGNGGATTGVVQVGNGTTATVVGTFDQPLNFNLGTGGENVLYARTTTSRSTGNEINPARILNVLFYDDNDPSHTLTIAGGDLSATTQLVLTNGRIVTGANTLYLSSGAATVTRTNGYVDGNYKKSYAAAGSKTFEVGTANGYSPVAVNMTAAGSFPADFTVKAVQAPMPSLVDPTKALQRYWTLTASGVTADLTFNYLDPLDIPGTATEANFVIFKYDGSLTQPGGSVNTAGNSATITGVTSFSDWTLAEPAASFTPTPTPTNTPVPTDTPTVTPTNTPAVTDTPTPTPATMLNAHVTWQGRGTQPDSRQQMPVTLTVKSGATEVNYPSQTTDSNGNFSVSLAGLPDGLYTWRAKGPQFLANSGTFTKTSGPPYSVGVEMGTMRTGDCNNDNVVNIGDYGIIRGSLGKGPGDPGYDPRAELDGIDPVNISDYNLMRANFGAGGSPAIRPGQK